MNTIQVSPLPIKDLSIFLAYLEDHLSDNGQGITPLFQPLSKRDAKLSDTMRHSFASGLSRPTDQLGWRRVWVARTKTGTIVGHIDLRAHREKHTLHRALLGMGVDRDHRRLGIGRLLMNTAFTWAREETKLAFIDLQVLSTNRAAITLYQKSGFSLIGEIQDMFRIDGQSYSYTYMDKAL
ncbi:MAG: GNAT family N-acetyltransferase [Saprospiraceae bacterium]|nr:GNAT family N-acetyltransferase [Saprospiraceae bacterium]